MRHHFYNDKFILKYSEPSEITKDFCDAIKRKEVIDYHYKENFSPNELLAFINEKL